MSRAFTLIETIVVIALFVVIMLALANLFVNFYTLYGYQEAFTATTGSAQTAINSMEESVRAADAVLASHTFSGTTYTSDATTLVLELPSIDNTGTVILGTYDYVAFYANGTNLYRVLNAGAGSARVPGIKLLSTTLASLDFSYDNADVTKAADIVTSAVSKQQTAVSHLQESVRLRNVIL